MTYRTIYQKHYGDIPKDEEGRSYDIHHIDGDHTNNDISNLVAVTIREHYEIHKKQRDWGACTAIAMRTQISPEEKSQLASLAAKKLLDDGTHPFIGERNPVYKQILDGKNVFTTNNPVYLQLNTGNHASQRPEVLNKISKALVEYNKDPKAREHKSVMAKKKVEEGTHNFLGGEIQRNMNKRRLEEGTHTTQKEWVCEKCGKIGKGSSNHTRWHGDNCKKVKKND